jgi:hypothetical protein
MARSCEENKFRVRAGDGVIKALSHGLGHSLVFLAVNQEDRYISYPVKS